jgi:DNA-binding transcriptional LysR family regulator
MIGDLHDWTLLHVLLETARAGSFQKATETLAASQPTIGRKIDQLEAKVGVQLLIRTAAGIDLTAAGKRVVAVAEQMEALAKTLPLETATEQQLSGTIRFKGSDGVGGYWLPHLMADFLKQYPGITISVVCADYSYVPDLTRREADITVVYKPPIDPDVCVLSKGDLLYKPMTSKGYAEKHGVPSTFEELAEHPFIAHESYFDFAPGEPWERLGNLLRRHKRIAYRSNSSRAIGQAVRRGLGITYMPAGVGDREPDALFFDIEGWTASRPFWLVCHRNVKDVPAIRALADHLKVSLFDGSDGSMSRPPD